MLGSLAWAQDTTPQKRVQTDFRVWERGLLSSDAELRSSSAVSLVDSAHPEATLNAVRLFEVLPDHPMITMPAAAQLIEASSPTAAKAIEMLCHAGILHEVTGKRRDRVYAYQSYLDVLAEDTSVPGR